MRTSIQNILKHAKKRKKIRPLPNSPRGQIETIRKLFKKDKEFLEVIDLYEMLRKIEILKQERIGEFRKNVTLKLSCQGKEFNINLEQLKTYAKNAGKVYKHD